MSEVPQVLQDRLEVLPLTKQRLLNVGGRFGEVTVSTVVRTVTLLLERADEWLVAVDARRQERRL